jgi:two-component system nitrogen regulation sensor histidine kinase NtrY
VPVSTPDVVRGRGRLVADIRSLGARLFSFLLQVRNRPGLRRFLTVGLLAAALASGIATYAATTGTINVGPETQFLLRRLDLVLLSLLAGIVAWQLFQLWLARRRGLVGARLRVRLVLWFSLVALAPAVIISTFSFLFFVFGLDTWFSLRVRTAVNESLFIATAYLRENQEGVINGTGTIALYLRRPGPVDLEKADIYQKVMTAQGRAFRLDTVAIVDGNNNVLTQGALDGQAPAVLKIAPEKYKVAREGGGTPALIYNPPDDRIRGLALLDPQQDMFVYTERLLDPRVIAHGVNVEAAVREYEQMQGERGSVLTTFSLIFVIVALLLLFAAIWAAMMLATRLVDPVSRLVTAAGRIGSGDLRTRVPEGDPGDEIGVLSQAFNRMTRQIESQRNELVEANLQVEERRRFTEVVLAGVSAGVIGLDEQGCINLPNRSASDLLATDLVTRIGERIAAVVPEMASLVEAARQRPSWLAESQISLVRGAETRTLLVRVVAEFMATRLIGFVVTFDDVTELLSAQRKAAWADVARRIAHEIKNPLTPIQLSAERLKRKYLKEIASDPETFVTCTDTIVRQVGDIGRMVDEFSAFARMPAPVMAKENLVELCLQAIFLQQSANPAITYSTDLPPDGLELSCDAQQIGQALTNLLKNAAEAVDARIAATGNAEPPGQVHLALRESDDDVVLSIEDNGRGLPDQGRERLTEPYVTTRARGTGLGLAIVKNIVEDHGALLQLDDRPGGGAIVRVTFRHTRAEDGAGAEARNGGLARAHGS